MPLIGQNLLQNLVQFQVNYIRSSSRGCLASRAWRAQMGLCFLEGVEGVAVAVGYVLDEHGSPTEERQMESGLETHQHETTDRRRFPFSLGSGARRTY